MIIKSPDFFVDALDISYKIFLLRNIKINKDSRDYLKDVIMVGLTHYLFATCEDPESKDKPRFSSAEDQYIFVALFTCTRRLTLKYLILKKKNGKDISENTIYFSAVAAFVLAYKSFAIDEMECVPGGRKQQEYLDPFYHYQPTLAGDILTLLSQDKAAASFDKDIYKIEREMYKMSGFTPCLKEYNEMIEYIKDKR
uniref:Uncharacterized protein n=1 Tax=Iridovirus LCIVAC01 TaxID=2506607 RepID=A0A481YQ61_9VIRU|nr:MAG: hypothetical protein LCIVAC01_01270 [Iridovirus LCIVAC01]